MAKFLNNRAYFCSYLNENVIGCVFANAYAIIVRTHSGSNQHLHQLNKAERMLDEMNKNQERLDSLPKGVILPNDYLAQKTVLPSKAFSLGDIVNVPGFGKFEEARGIIRFVGEHHETGFPSVGVVSKTRKFFPLDR